MRNSNSSGSVEESVKLGLLTLTAIVFGMMVGSGIFNIPQNMAIGAGPLAVAISWAVTAAGMLLLAATFKILASRRPDLDAGIYQYAQVGFGNFAGFNIAWGYWLCTCFANVAYAVMLNDSFGAFFPPLLSHGWPTLLFGSLLIWGMFFIVIRGISTARIINNLLAGLKVGSICLIVILLFINLRYRLFEYNLQEEAADSAPMWVQIRSTMMVTLWCFIGIEGAVMLSARARRHSDVGKATVAGFLIAWVLYLLVSVLCYGVMSRASLAGLDDPSVAYALRAVCGEWAYWFVIISVIVSLLGGWLAWTLVCAQVPFEAATVNIFPRSFLRLNRHGMPAFGLFISSLIMQTFMILVMLADDIYMAALTITGMMVLPAYLSGGLYLCKVSAAKEKRRWREGHLPVGILCSGYCLWLIYAGGINLLCLTSIFYIAGSGFYIKARRERAAAGHPLRFTRADRLTLLLLIAGVVVSLCQAAGLRFP